ncbi:MAG: SRPBCC family protein [Chitinophagaceae bacterium]|nr:SRPBCC family protein [Chitinophagaceae bacterium]
MPTIHLTTFIEAPVERVFELSRSIKMHKRSMVHFKEELVSGPFNDLAELGDEITWKARHLFKTRVLKIKIVQLNKYESFVDEQVSGDFVKMKHEHHFKPVHNGVIMIDLFHFESPYGKVGKWFNQAYLTRYLKKLLEQRNQLIKKYAESDQWKMILN